MRIICMWVSISGGKRVWSKPKSEVNCSIN